MVVDPAEVQPNVPALVIRREREFGSVPPRATERTVLGHSEQRKILPDGISCSRDITQILAVIRIGISLIGDQCSHNCGRHRSGMPAVSLVPTGRDLLPFGTKKTTSLQR